MKNKRPSEEQIQRTKEILKIFNIENGEELTKLHCKSEVILLSDTFEKFIKVSFNGFGINLFYCVSLRGYTYQCDLKILISNYKHFKVKI